MAQGIELILGFERKDRDVLTKALGLTLDEEGELHGAVVAVRRACDRAHSAAIGAMGWTEQGKSKNRYKRVETPAGTREMVAFEVECFAENEFDELPDDETAAIGVAITGRYFPTFADYKDANGTLSPMVFNDELRLMMDVARTAIEAELPIFKQAVWMVRERFY